METWKNYKVPTAPELFWMIPHDEDFPQDFLPLPDGISIDPSEDFVANEDGRRVITLTKKTLSIFNSFVFLN